MTRGISWLGRMLPIIYHCFPDLNNNMSILKLKITKLDIVVIERENAIDQGSEPIEVLAVIDEPRIWPRKLRVQ